MRQGGDEPEIRFVEPRHEPAAGTRAPDVLDTTRPLSVLDRLGRRELVIAAVVAALILGAALGYISGKHAGKKVIRVAASPSSTAATRPVPTSPVSATGAQCSAHSGTQLQLGIEITNASAAPVTLGDVHTDLPLGGLRQVRSSVGSCGELPSVRDSAIAGFVLGPGATTWITVLMQVLVTCPGPLPAQFVLGYTQAGHAVTDNLGGFSDLGNVPYPGCTAAH